MNDWESEWQPLIDAIGTDFGAGVIREGADPIEQTAIRRFLEPLEFDCPLHYDEATAQQHGYEGVIAPYSGVMTWTIPPLWAPGETVFISADRNAQPMPGRRAEARTRVPGPQTPNHFATDVEIEYFRPCLVGDHLSSSCRKLLSCVPKETSVGIGAFTVWESEVHNQRNELVALIRMGSYDYNPR